MLLPVVFETALAVSVQIITVLSQETVSKHLWIIQQINKICSEQGSEKMEIEVTPPPTPPFNIFTTASTTK